MSVAVLLALAMGATLGHTILGRMDTISRAAGEIMAGDLSRRVPVSGRDDEFDALAGRLNAMLDRIQQLIKS
jgi:HAMP domain-containing protein